MLIVIRGEVDAGIDESRCLPGDRDFGIASIGADAQARTDPEAAISRKVTANDEPPGGARGTGRQGADRQSHILDGVAGGLHRAVPAIEAQCAKTARNRPGGIAVVQVKRAAARKGQIRTEGRARAGLHREFAAADGRGAGVSIRAAQVNRAGSNLVQPD